MILVSEEFLAVLHEFMFKCLSNHYNLGSTGSLSIASTPNTHSCTRYSGSFRAKHSSNSITNANSLNAKLRFFDNVSKIRS